MNFTYLLGAGASAKSLPTVKKFNESLNSYRDFIVYNVKKDDLTIQEDDDIREKFLEDLNYVIEEVQKHASIDTFAKKLYLTDDSERLNKLKAMIDAFLTTKQVEENLDTRYDAFLATLLTLENKKLKLPPNVNVLSWNYDFQFEISMWNFIKTSKTKELEEKFRIVPNSEMDFSLDTGFSLTKLNGTCAGRFSSNLFGRKKFIEFLISTYKENDLNQKVKDIYVRVIQNYFATLKHLDDAAPSILFAWEKNTLSESIRKYAKEKVKHTNELIVIGYSFPTFNREIDKEILGSMDLLSKIYIQSLPNDIDGIEYRVKELSSKNIEVEKITSGDEFFIPFKL